MKPDCPNCHEGSCYHIVDEAKFIVRPVMYNGEFSHWESEFTFQGEVYCEGTAPTFWGAFDLLTDYVFEQTFKDDHPTLDHNWFKRDANDRQKSTSD